MSTYLSIDIDFWNKNRDYEHLRNFLELVRASSSNISIVDSHEQLKDHVNRSNCSTLINVDYHSDIYDIKNPVYKDETFNCGTWVNFVDFRYKGKFVWIHPHPSNRISNGYCHGEGNPFLNPRISGWNNVCKIHSKYPEEHIDWGDIMAVGIAFSYKWLRDGVNDKIVCIAKNILGKRPQINPRALTGKNS